MAKPKPLPKGQVTNSTTASVELPAETRADLVGWPSVSVVVPVYNSEQSLPLLCERLYKVLPEITDHFEIVLVNDGSRDGSWEVICRLVERYPHVQGICMMRNYGQHNALLCGIRAARHELIVNMDDDLQHPPEMIIPLIKRFTEGYDVVYGVPMEEQHGLLRDLASQITKLALQSAMGAEVARNTSAFRVFRTQLRDAFAQYRSPYVSIDVLLTWATTRFSSVKVRHDLRRLGQSNYTFRKLVTHAFNMMTGFSTMPLQIASLVGLAFAVFGLLVLSYVVGRYLIQGGSVAGFPFLASVIAIFSGAQLFALGIIGEYLARMHFRMMDRPTYTVREHISPQGE
jgi:glycosyltransferase involved in cell wall biosynthesis